MTSPAPRSTAPSPGADPRRATAWCRAGCADGPGPGCADRGGHPAVSRRAVLAGGAGLVAAAGLAACAGEQGAADFGAAGDVLARVDEVPVGDVVVVTSSSDWPIALTRTDETTVVAMSGMCTHQRCALVPQDGDLYCNCHGALFAVPDGAVIEGPAPEPLPPIEVTVEGTDVVMS